MRIERSQYSSIEQISRTLKTNNSNIIKQENKSFQSILQEKINKENKIIFSKHANLRLANRNINLSNNQIQRLEQGIEKAKEKGIKESLVLMDNIAFVVNIKNNTVITAMEQQSNEDSIFTNIDGAVII